MTINLPMEKFGLHNKHVTIPILLSFAVEMVQIWAPIWYAMHSEAIRQTQRALFAYGIFAASTTGSAPQSTPPPTTTPAPTPTK